MNVLMLSLIFLASFSGSVIINSVMVRVSPDMEQQLLESGCLAYNPKTGELEVRK